MWEAPDLASKAWGLRPGSNSAELCELEKVSSFQWRPVASFVIWGLSLLFLSLYYSNHFFSIISCLGKDFGNLTGDVLLCVFLPSWLTTTLTPFQPLKLSFHVSSPCLLLGAPYKVCSCCAEASCRGTTIHVLFCHPDLSPGFHYILDALRCL